MSFWSNFSVKAPAVFAGSAGLTGIAAMAFPAQAPLFQGLTALFGYLGASLHTLNPVPVSAPVNADVGQQPPANAVIAPPVVPVIQPVPTPVIADQTPVQQVPVFTPQLQPIDFGNDQANKVEQATLVAAQVAQIVQQTLQALRDAEKNQPPTG